MATQDLCYCGAAPENNHTASCPVAYDARMLAYRQRVTSYAGEEPRKVADIEANIAIVGQEIVTLEAQLQILRARQSHLELELWSVRQPALKPVASLPVRKPAPAKPRVVKPGLPGLGDMLAGILEAKS